MSDLDSIRSTQFDSQTSRSAHALALERGRAEAEERRAKALMTAATAALILESINAVDLDLVTILDGATARVAMKVLNGEVPVRNGSEAAAIIREFTAARIRIAGDTGAGGGIDAGGDLSIEERRQNVLELREVADARAREMEEALATTEGPDPGAA